MLRCPDATDEASIASLRPAACCRLAEPPVQVRHFARDDSVFLDDDYLIKGVAGAILWKLLGDRQSGTALRFSTRALRLGSGAAPAGRSSTT